MDVNATLLVQALTFAIMVWLMKRCLWDPLMQLVKTRRACIARGAAAAERGRREFELAEQRARQLRAQARVLSEQVIAQAERTAAEFTASLRAQAQAEADRLVTAAKSEIRREMDRARHVLQPSAAELARIAAGRLLGRERPPAPGGGPDGMPRGDAGAIVVRSIRQPRGGSRR